MTKRLLGLPVRSRRSTAIAALLLFAFYVATMCRSLSMYDSPELALVAEQFGLGHPFGQPLHTLLGGLLTRLPGVVPLIALNGLSALAAALTVVPASSFAETLIRPGPGCPEGDSRLIPPVVALLGAYPLLWEPATRIEVYPLAIFFAFWAAARFANALLDEEQGALPYFTTGLALGLSASANPVCAVGVALAMTPRLLMAVVRREIPRRVPALVAAGGSLGLVCYAYVFAVAGRKDAVVWGAPTDGASIKHYFTAADFSNKGVATFSEWWEHVVELFVWSLHNGFFALLLAGFTGFVLYARRRGLGRFFFNVTWIFFVAFAARDSMFATDVLDHRAYLSLPAWVAVSGVALLVAYLAARNAWALTAALGAVTLLVMLAPPSPVRRTRHLDSFTEDIAREALLAAPADGIVIVERDHWIGPMWYLQEQRELRPDVVLIAYGLAASEWYWDHVYRHSPGLELIELRGPGGRDARLRRFLRANPKRPVQIERVELANRLGLPTCAGDWLLDVRSRCSDSAAEPSLARYASATLAELGEGSPGTDGLIAAVTLARGHDLYSQGFPRTAVAALLAGVPRFEGAEELDLSQVPERIQPLVRPSPVYEPRVALGHPAQNLHYASVIARATGAIGLARYFEGLAEALGPVRPKFASLAASPANL